MSKNEFMWNEGKVEDKRRTLNRDRNQERTPEGVGEPREQVEETGPGTKVQPLEKSVRPSSSCVLKVNRQENELFFNTIRATCVVLGNPCSQD